LTTIIIIIIRNNKDIKAWAHLVGTNKVGKFCTNGVYNVYSWYCIQVLTEPSRNKEHVTLSIHEFTDLSLIISPSEICIRVKKRNYFLDNKVD